MIQNLAPRSKREGRLGGQLFSAVVVTVVALTGCLFDSGGDLGDECSSDSDCDTDKYKCVKCSVRNTCFYNDWNDPGDDEYGCKTYGAGTPTSSGSSSSSSSGSSSSNGACAFVDSRLNRLLCEQKPSSSCTGKFFGSGTSCSAVKCTSTSPSSCTLSGSGSSSSSSGGSTSGGTGTHEECSTNTQTNCTMKFCAGGPQGCYYIANGTRFTCNCNDLTTCLQRVVEHCQNQ